MLLQNNKPTPNLEAIRALIETYKSREAFLSLMSATFGHNSEAYLLIADAEAMVAEGFAGIRRHTGEGYDEHPRAVAIIGLLHCGEKNHKAVISDLLHDSVEDTDATVSLIRKRFGRGVAFTVKGQSKPPVPIQGDMKTEDYIEICSRIIFNYVRQHGPLAMRGKCRDRLHNMLTLWGSPEKKLQKIKETIEFVLPISIQVNYLWPELMLATAEQLERLGIDDTKP